MDLAKMIDYTLLKPQATEKDVVELCHRAQEHKFAMVCINPTFVQMAVKLLSGTGIGVAAVVGFPFGYTYSEIKAQEIYMVKAQGAAEVDAVINIGLAKSGLWGALERDIAQVVEAAQKCGLTNKIIIEISLLTEKEQRTTAEIIKNVGADFLKTSTGFTGVAVTAADVINLKSWLGNSVKIKAAGGIRTKSFALELIQAGAERLGTSALLT